MTARDVGPALSAEIKAILERADNLRELLRTEFIPEREPAEREIASIETSARRVLHLIGAR